MSKYSTAENSAIAFDMIDAWECHQQAIEDNALSYLDSLINAITTPKPLLPAELREKLQIFVPGMQLNTARRLINLKYGKPAETELLGPTIN